MGDESAARLQALEMRQAALETAVSLDRLVPSCVVYNSVNQSIVNNTLTVPGFDSEVFDTHAFHSVSSNTGRFTIPPGLGGLYVATALLYWDTSTGEYLGLIADQDGIAWGRARWVTSASSANQQPIVTVPMRLAPGDYVELTVRHVTGAARNLLGGSGTTYFAIARLGGY